MQSLKLLGLQYRIGVCRWSLCSRYNIWVEGERGNYPFTPHYKSKKYMFSLGDQFFSKSRRCSLLILKAQWLKLPAWKVGDRGFWPLSGLQVSKKQNNPSLLPRKDLLLWGVSGDQEIACSALDRQGPNFASCVWRTLSSYSIHHPKEALLAQFSLYVHKGCLTPHSFYLNTIH